MKAVARSSYIAVVALVALALTLTTGIAPVSAAESEDIDREAVSRLHDALVELKASGEDVEGDISEEALIEEFSSSQITIQAAPNGCSVPKSLKKVAKKWNKVFKGTCDNHDRCYGKYSKKNRKTCDIEFHKAMKKKCKARSDTFKCNRVADAYYAGVRAGGWRTYEGKGKNN